MNQNYTHIVMLVDASGSMASLKQATIDGVNTFIESQKSLPSTDRNLSLDENLADGASGVKCTLTLVTFTSNNGFSLSNALSGRTAANGEPQDPYVYTEICRHTDIATAPALADQNYHTDGGTPLIDAFYRAIQDCTKYIASLPQEEKPARVIMISNTDGEENSSTRHTKEELVALIKRKQDDNNWQFIYLGANQDAIQESSGYGLAAGQAMTYQATNKGVNHSYDTLSANVMMKRSVAPTMMYCASVTDMASGGTGLVGEAMGSVTSDGLAAITRSVQTARTKITSKVPTDTEITAAVTDKGI